MQRQPGRTLVAEVLLTLPLLYMLLFGSRLSVTFLRLIAPAANFFTGGNYLRWFGVVDNVAIGLALVAGAIVIRLQRPPNSVLGRTALGLEVVGYLALAVPFLIAIIYGVTTFPLRLVRSANPLLFFGAELMLAGLILSKVASWLASLAARHEEWGDK